MLMVLNLKSLSIASGMAHDSGNIKTKGDRALLYTFKTLGIALLIVLVASNYGKTESWPSITQSVFSIAGALIVIAFFLCAVLLIIRTVDPQRGDKSLWAQVRQKFARFALYIVLPGVVVTALIITWAIVTNQPGY
jgi:hypothetical protein